jgi:hypothetical protein
LKFHHSTKGQAQLCSAIRAEVYLSASFGNGNVPVFLVQEKETSAPLVGYSHKAQAHQLVGWRAFLNLDNSTSFCQLYNFRNRRGNPQRLVNSGEIVMHEVNSNHVSMVVASGVGQSTSMPNAPFDCLQVSEAARMSRNRPAFLS